MTLIETYLQQNNIQAEKEYKINRHIYKIINNKLIAIKKVNICSIYKNNCLIYSKMYYDENIDKQQIIIDFIYKIFKQYIRKSKLKTLF